MRATLSLVRREFSAYFLSPIGYVVLAVFLAVTGGMFYLALGQLTAAGPVGSEFPMQRLLGLSDLRTISDVLAFLAFWLVFLITPALLTMRLFAEERSTGTLEMLLTAPLRDWQIVLSKFAACFAFYLVLWLPTLLYLPVFLGRTVGAGNATIDPWPVATTYLGLALAGAMLLALGLFVSSLVRSPMIAALVSLLASLAFVGGGFALAETDVGSPLYRVLFYFTMPLHFERNFSRGLVDTRQLVLYVSLTLFCLFLTVRSLESRRWR